jgi:hypothetical protein
MKPEQLHSLLTVMVAMIADDIELSHPEASEIDIWRQRRKAWDEVAAFAVNQMKESTELIEQLRQHRHAKLIDRGLGHLLS